MREAILQAISAARDRQDELFPEQAPEHRVQRVHPHTMVSILVEEVGEVAKAALEADEMDLRTELVQTAAVCVKWLEVLGYDRLPPLELQTFEEPTLQELGCGGTDTDDDPRRRE